MESSSSFFLKGLENVNGRWDLIEIIGEGTYGEVYKGVDKKGKQVAVKVIENAPNKHDECHMESLILQRYGSHRNIVDYFGTFLQPAKSANPTAASQIWIVIEYCEGGSVSELAKTINDNGNSLSENVIKYILHQTLNGVGFLHSNRIIHRDIKGPNILMTTKGEVKLIDCGVSAIVEHTMGRRHSSVGSPFWMAPEVIACEQQLDYTYDNRCDIWSLGITAIELADGEPPMADLHPMSALFKIPRNPPPTVKRPKKWSKLYLQFISRAVTKDFEARPSAPILLKDPFLKECRSHTKTQDYRKELMSLIHVTAKQLQATGATSNQNSLQKRMEMARKNRQYLDVDDLATLSNLTADTIFTYIRERFAGEQVYTYVGDILIAVNPFKEQPIYGRGASLLYQNAQKEALPPHIFMVACATYQALLRKQIDQCCVISGESGSGKTVSANFLVQQLAWIGRTANSNASVNENLVKKILQVNPLMEAFGCAQTAINRNSSRYGKFLELHFTQTGALVGAQLSEYLLEKSRVVSQPRSERNFHVLYYMIAGLDFHKKLDQFELNTSSKHRYLNTDELSLAECACTSEMQVKFTQVQQCFQVLGFTQDEIQSLYCILAAIIHLGDIEFMVDDLFSYEGEKAKIVNFDTLETVCSLLCIEQNDLSEGLVTNSSVTRGETITRNNTVEQALDCRDATAKALYGRLVSWIVKKINALLRAEDKTNTLHMRIGILDMFGFENFAQNSFEQLCINIANEQLQFYFNEHVFVWEMEEFRSEGIKGDDLIINFENNKPILDLFLQKPVGILALLDEESRFPKASDLTLVEKFQDNIDSEYIIASKETNTFFTIKHYAEKVTYDATGFLEKNRDTLSLDVVQTFRQSNDKTLAALFLDPVPNQKQDTRMSGNSSHSSQSAATNRFQQTVSVHFRQSLRTLLSKVIKAEPHFVRCIRPNRQNNPNVFDEEKVLEQLKYTGVLETAKIRKKGFSDRILFKDFIQRYKFIIAGTTERVPPSGENCVRILRSSEIDQQETWKVGRTKIFLRYWQVEKLSSMAEDHRAKITLCQKVARKFLLRGKVRQEVQIRNDAATKIRAAWLGHKHKRLYDQRDRSSKKPPVVRQDSQEQSAVATDRSMIIERPTSKMQHYRRESVSSGHHRIPHLNRTPIPKAKPPEKPELVSIHNVEQWSDRFPGDKWERLRAYIHQRAITKGKVDPWAMRPYYRNMKREKRGYEDYDDFYSSDEGDQHHSKSMKAEVRNDYERVSDPEGQAALEETRTIILLSQIDLASKEVLEMLRRTSYPVIHSIRAKANKEGGMKIKNQKLDHKDRTIAVVEGFGDPLRQKYRLAKLHVAEEGNEKEKEAYRNDPMLGLVEKPKTRETENKSGDEKKKKKVEKKPAKVSRKQLPPAKAVVKEDFYPTRKQQERNNAPRTQNEWFYPTGAKANNVEKTRKSFESRQQQQTPNKRPHPKSSSSRNNNEISNYRDRVLESRREYYSRNEHKPFSYLDNERADQRKLLNHHNSNPSREVQRQQPYKHWDQPPVTNTFVNYNPRRNYTTSENFNSNISAPNSSRSYYDRRPPPEVNQDKPTKPPQNKPTKRHSPPPVFKTYDNYFNDPPPPVSPRSLKPRPLPGMAQRPIEVKTTPSEDYYFIEKPKTRRPNGFNYGLKRESVLQDLKLKKTGRLKDLLQI